MNSYFKYDDAILFCEDVSLQLLAEKMGTPAYVYSSAALLDPVHEFQKGLDGLNHTICFAMKSNSNLSVLKLLAAEGVGVDIVSGGELFRAGKAGISAQKIVFSGVGKTAKEMQEALSYQGGIYSFNVESTQELAQLSSIALKLGKRARVALRFNPDVNPKTHPYISTGLKKNKFGIHKAEILSTIRDLDQFPGVDLCGISIHIGSQLTSIAPLRDAFSRVDELMTQLAPMLRKPLEFVDLGGGLGVSYHGEKTSDITTYCKVIQKFFGPKSKWPSLHVLIEPGRVISANAGVLLTQVLFKKEKGSKDFLVVDAGMNDLIRPALYQSIHQIVPLVRSKSKSRSSKRQSTKKTDLVGPVCETADCFLSNQALKTSYGPGEYLAIRSAGAYGFSMASNYNSRPRPVEVLVQGASYQVVRKRETYDDLIRGETQ